MREEKEETEERSEGSFGRGLRGPLSCWTAEGRGENKILINLEINIF